MGKNGKTDKAGNIDKTIKTINTGKTSKTDKTSKKDKEGKTIKLENVFKKKLKGYTSKHVIWKVWKTMILNFCRTQEGPAYMRVSRFRPCVRPCVRT